MKVLCIFIVQLAYVYTATTCTSGSFLLPNGACNVCNPGFMCNGGTDNQFKCQLGTYSAFGATSCTSCQAGFKCTAPEQLPVRCEYGQYSKTGWSVCLPCPAGYYCPDPSVVTVVQSGYYALEGSFEETKCERGYRCPYTHITQIQCTAGTYSLEGAIVCIDCPAGQYCPSAVVTPINCPFGTYSIGIQTSCTDCPSGFTCNDQTKQPLSCSPGQYNNGKQETCVNCPAGHKCPTIALLNPIPCAQGEYAPSSSTICISCPAGYECPDRTTSTQCQTGEYSPTGNEHCVECPAGSQCPTESLAPETCALGYYSGTGDSSCTICPAGSKCPDPSFGAIPCPLGTHADTTGQTSCAICPSMHTCATPTASPVQCSAGTYPDPIQKTCVTCPAGFECSSTQVTLCASGFYSLDNENRCTLCPSGKYCAQVYLSPVVCASGTFSTQGQTQCSTCQDGWECKDKTGLVMLACHSGQYSKNGSCVACSSGKTCPFTYMEIKENCPSGYYSVGNQATCTKCPVGYECPSDNVVPTTTCANKISLGSELTCPDCPAGHACDGYKPYPCPKGFFSALADQNCQLCSDGMECVTGVEVSCGAGKYSSVLDIECIECPVGYECPNAENKFPTKCGKNKYSLRPGASSCSSVPPGFYTTEASQYYFICPAGYECPDSGIALCPDGKYSYAGESSCTVCRDGFVCFQGAQTPTPGYFPCPLGFYCTIVSGSVMQIPCAGGTFGIADRRWTDVCENCPAGYYCNEGTGDYTLFPCPRGYYCPRGSEFPTQCPAGTFIGQKGAQNIAGCMECSAGYFCNIASSFQTICPQGYYCPRGSFENQYPCPQGYYGGLRTGLTDQSECEICPAGHYCPEATATPTPVPLGYYQPHLGQHHASSAMKCPAKYPCASTGQTKYEGSRCKPGHYCPAGTTAEDEFPCPAGTYTDDYDLIDIKLCRPCPRGYVCIAGTSSQFQAMVLCAEGYYCPLGTKTATEFPCPAGTYAPTTGTQYVQDCLPCPWTNYCPAGQGTIAANTRDCAAGHYCPSGTKTDTQFPCPAGTYINTPIKWVSQCLRCMIGKYCPEASSAPVNCADGYYNNLSHIASACSLCPAGSLCATASGTIDPTPCVIGKYSDVGQTTCTDCPIGSYCNKVGTTITQMNAQKCPAGTLCPLATSVYPNLAVHGCVAGKYCLEGSIAATDCPAGTINTIIGRRSLLECTLTEGGYYTIAGASSFTGSCLGGYYCPAGSVQEDQIACPAGTYRTLLKGSKPEDCSICPSGFYCVSGTAIPVDCPLGNYCPMGSIQPEKCPIGTLGTVIKLTDSNGCDKCPPGQYCPETGQSTTAYQCDAGFYCIGGAFRPDPLDLITGSKCPAGSYCTVGSVAPLSCVQGKFNQAEGGRSAADCSDCWPGYYCQTPNLPAPTGKCLKGYYCVGGNTTPTGQTTVDPTDKISQAGYYAEEGSPAEYQCPRGTYNTNNQQSVCKDCEEGNFCPDQGMTVTQNCPAGHYCPSNEWFRNNSLYYDKKRCPRGTYRVATNGKVITECTDCDEGKYCDQEGLTIVSGPCLAGFYCSSKSISPIPAIDNLLSQNGPCKEGTYCDAGASTSIDCVLGTFSGSLMNTLATQCLNCPLGKYCDAVGSSTPTDNCDIGFFCATSSQVSNPVGNDCATTEYCPVGSSEAITCPPGFYQDTIKQGGCKVCPKGSYCVGGQKFDCPVGYTCPKV